MNNPCYDTKTHTDCPRRAVGCSTDCPDWALYVEKRDKIWQARKKEVNLRTAIRDIGPMRNKTFRNRVWDKQRKINNK